MNDMVKNSIDARKAGVLNAYKIKDENLLRKLDDLFERINQFGETCLDAMDFESKFANSELNQEYIALFTEIASCSEQVIYEAKVDSTIKSDKEKLLEDAQQELRYQVDEATMPARRIARQEAYDAARNTPIIGDLMYAKQNIDMIGKIGGLFKKKKKDNEEKKDDEKENNNQ